MQGVCAATPAWQTLHPRPRPNPQYNSFSGINSYTISSPTNINVLREGAGSGFPGDFKFYDLDDGNRDSIVQDQVVVTYGEIGAFSARFGRSNSVSSTNYFGLAFEDLGWGTAQTNTTGGVVHTIVYYGNGATSGTPPANQTGIVGSDVVISAPSSGALSWPGYTFTGWNSQPDGSGTP